MLHFQELNCSLGHAWVALVPSSRGDTVVAGGTPFMEDSGLLCKV